MDTGDAGHTAGLSIAIALVGGLLAQIVGRHLRLPGIVILLGMGVVLGPEVLGWVQPDALGSALPTIVGFAVAVILFEGGMNLNWGRLRREGKAIRRLITVGALVTAVGGTLIGMFVLGWPTRESVLFGTLVIVTGPTVVTPLLRRIHVQKSVSLVLEAEGVLIDAVGAVVATVALSVALSPSTLMAAKGVLHFGLTLGLGVAIGLVGGLLLAFLLRFHEVIPEGLENVFILSSVLALFQVSEWLFSESGIAAVTVAGIVVGNSKTRIQRDLLDFKEQLTVMFIGLLFVILAANVSLERVVGLGRPGLIAVVLLMLVVRPINIWVSTWGTELKTRDKLFMSWIAPRGIVAAAVASLFAERLTADGSHMGETLRAMVFVVIAITVVSAGLTGGVVAWALRLRRPRDNGWVILGANPFARAVAHRLRRGAQEVLNLDTNDEHCTNAEREGLRVFYANGLDENVLERAQIDSRAGAIGLTGNAAVNLLFVTRAKRQGGVKALSAAMPANGPAAKELKRLRGGKFSGKTFSVDAWSQRIARDAALISVWEVPEAPSGAGGEAGDHEALKDTENLLPVAHVQRGRVLPFQSGTRPKAGDRVEFLINMEQSESVNESLLARGWRHCEDHPALVQETDAAPAMLLTDPISAS